MLTTTCSRNAPELSVIYKIPCDGDSCDSSYIGQSCRGLETRLNEVWTERGFKYGNQRNSFLLYAWYTNHPPGLDKTEIVHNDIGSSAKRLFLELAIIRSVKNFNSDLRQRVDFNLSRLSAAAVLLWDTSTRRLSSFRWAPHCGPWPLIYVFGITLQGRWFVNRNHCRVNTHMCIIYSVVFPSPPFRTLSPLILEIQFP